MGCASVTLTFGPLTGVNRSDRTSTSSYSTGMLHTQAEADSGVTGAADWLLRVAVSVTTELLPVDVELVWLPLTLSLLRSSSALRPVLFGLHPTEVGMQSRTRTRKHGGLG